MKVKVFDIVRFPCMLLVLLFLFACREKTIKEEVEVKTVKDDLGRTVEIPAFPKRVISLSPSITEILYAIGVEDRLIARTQNDSFPKAVLAKPLVNNYPVDLEQLVFLHPDLALVKEGMLSLDDAERIQELGIPVYFQKYNSIPAIYSGIRVLGNIMQTAQRAGFVADSLKRQIDAIAEKNKAVQKKKVLLVISEEPVFVYGKDSYASSLLEVAGGVNAVTEVLDNPFPVLRREYILKIDPEVFIGVNEKSFFKKYPELKRTEAYKNKKIFKVNSVILSRPGPRVVEGIRALEKVIHEK